jgi:hypothetical protein
MKTFQQILAQLSLNELEKRTGFEQEHDPVSTQWTKVRLRSL